MRISILALLFLLSTPPFAFADIDDAPPPGAAAAEAPPPAGPRDEDRHARFSVGAGPAWVHVLRTNYAPAFTNNGFASPGRDRIGFDLLAYWTTDTRWQLGLTLNSFSFEQDVGSWSADFSNSFAGLYAARNFSRDPDTDITLGAILGFNDSEVNVFSSGLSGRLRENAAVIAPSVGYAARVSRMAKIGLRGSYLIPFGESTQLSGQDLGVSKIGVRGFQLALQVIFSRY